MDVRGNFYFFGFFCLWVFGFDDGEKRMRVWVL